ncbi:MAG TPA: hypothetical protein VGE01_05235 [Fimbriimonas sp.]
MLGILLVGSAFALTACSSGGFDPNYSKEIKLSEAEKAKMQETMAGQAAPGAITPGQPVDTAAMKPPPGKGGR